MTATPRAWPATWRKALFTALTDLPSDARVPTRGACTRPEAVGVYILYEDGVRLGTVEIVYETDEPTARGPVTMYEVFYDSDKARREAA